MKTKTLFLAALTTFAFVSCADSEFIGDNSPNDVAAYGDGSINFGFDMSSTTRADYYGQSAAEKLGNYFYVVGTKGTEGTGNPSPDLVFDNYSVKYTANTANTTASNSANWEYVGVTADASHAKLSPNAQTIKYWDYNTAQYDFHAFSTGTKSAVTGKTTGTIGDNEINVTKSLYGTGLAGGATAYTFIVPNGAALSNLYVTDITPVAKAAYGKDVVLKFKNLGAKIRIALYETVPGYSVQAGSVKFYASATTPIKEGTGYVAPTTTGTLISTAEKGLPLKGTIEVSFPNVGTGNSSNANYNKASVNVTADVSAAANYEFTKTFGTIPTSEMVGKEGNETEGNLYLGRTFPTASYVGDANAGFYQLTFPVDDSHPLTLRVDYTLIATDGSGETIKVYGAKAVVPSTYTVWQPNYAYTYVFKIADNTNGWTDPDATSEGLTAITFDAVIADFTEVSGEQKTITTVATPSITTYQQNHTKTATPDEYSKATAKNIYVQVKKADGSLATDLSGTTGDGTDRSILFAVAAGTTEADVMDALEKRTTAIDAADVTGRNGLTLTKGSIKNDVDKIVNGVDDKAITVTAGTTGEIAISVAAGTYAYVYDYSAAAKTVVTEYQPVAVTAGSAIDGTAKTYYPIVIADDLAGIAVTAAEEAVDPDYIYFSKTTTDGGTTYTYSYISVANKTTVPAGVVKLAKSVVGGKDTVAGTTNAVAGTFYFDKYFSNNGKYAVKVIKIVA